MGGSTYTAYEFLGFIAEWDGTKGEILTETGEHVFVSRFMLKELGIFHSPTRGDRIHFWAEKHDANTYKLREVRMIATPESGERALTRLKNFHAAFHKPQEQVDERTYVEVVTGTVSCFSQKMGFGFIQLDDGSPVRLHITCLRASGHQTVAVGSVVRFEVLHRPGGSQAFRILSLTPP